MGTALVAAGAGVASAADTVETLPARQVRPGATLQLFGAAGNGGAFGNGSANGETYQWSFAANPDVSVVTDGNTGGIVGNDAFIAENVSFQLLNGSTREIVRATLTVDDGAGGVTSREVALDVVSGADEISDTPLEALAVDVNIAIEDGLRAMYLTQRPDGRVQWKEGSNAAVQDCATTAFSLWAFANRGHGPLAGGIYAPTAQRAVNFILTGTDAFDPALQARIGDPDSDGNGRAIALCSNGSPTGYASPIATTALIAAYHDAPLTVIANGPYAGETIFQVVQDSIDWIAFAQNDNGGRGGWRYTANAGSSDTSVDSWNYLALEGFENVFGGTVMDAVKTEAEYRIIAVQRADGQFDYASLNSAVGTANARTGGGISGLLMVSNGGRATPTAGDIADRLSRAVAWIGADWNRAGGQWSGNLNNYYAMWTQARALRLAGVETLVNGGITFDWETGEANGNGQVSPPGAREGYFPYLVRQQTATGHWPNGGYAAAWPRNLNTAFGVLILTPTVFGPPNAGPLCVAQDVVVPVDDQCAWSIEAGDVDGGSSDPDGDALIMSVDPSAGQGLAVTNVNLTVDDGNGLQTSCPAQVTPVDNIPPALDCGAGGPYECADGCAAANLNAVATDNCPGDLPVYNDGIACYPVGTTTVRFNTADASGNGASCEADVVVVDTTAPEVVVGSPSNEIWPPNHKCLTFDLMDACDVQISDACATDPADLGVRITGITSDEAFEVGAGGDGHHSDDIEILSETSFKLRAERQGGANGRFYTVHFQVTDPAGNATDASCEFVVPHDQSPKHIPVNDGPAVTCETPLDCACLDNPQAQAQARGR